MTEDGSFVIKSLHWSNWGSSAASATAISSASTCNPNCATGRRINRLVRVTLSVPGFVVGYEVYRCFELTVPSDPEADLHECLGLVGHYYGYVPAGRPSPQSSSSRGTDVRFFTPNGNIACEMFDNGASQGTVGCIMNSPPAIARLAANGLVSICQHQGLSCTGNLGDGPGIPDGKLPFGRTGSGPMSLVNVTPARWSPTHRRSW